MSRLMISNPRRMAHCRPLDKPVQNGLALTPAQMFDLQNQGLPISTQTSTLAFNDGVYKCDWDVPLDYRRGVDPADIFEAEAGARAKIVETIQKVDALSSKASDNV